MRYSDFKLFEDISKGLESGPPYPREDMDAVKNMQRKLDELGYDIGSTGVDGKYGPRTSRAVRNFKRDYDLSGDGLSMNTNDLEKLASAEPDDSAAMRRKIRSALGRVRSRSRAQAEPTPSLSQDSVTQGKVGAVLDLIAGPESGGRYDAVYPGRRRPQILDMTLDELFRDMRSRGRRHGSSASGRYQYIRSTLRSVTKEMGLNPRTTKFTPDTQDEIVIYHLRRYHGLDRWLSGRMSTEDFLNKLAGTWAGIPNASGRSSYAGVLDNKAGMSTDNAIARLNQIQTTGVV